MYKSKRAPSSDAVDRSLTPRGSRVACANSSASPSRRTSSTATRLRYYRQRPGRRCIESVARLSGCHRRLLSVVCFAHRNVRVWSRRPIMGTSRRARHITTAACGIWTSRPSTTRSSPSGVRGEVAKGNACFLEDAILTPLKKRGRRGRFFASDIRRGRGHKALHSRCSLRITEGGIGCWDMRD